MKKILILSSIAALGAFNAMGQGQVNLAATSTIGIRLMVQDPNVNGGAAAVIGTAAAADGFVGVGAGVVAIDVYGAPNGTSVAAAEATTPLFAGFNSASGLAAGQGTYAANTGFIPTTANISGWNGSTTLEFIVTAVSSNGVYTATGEATGISPSVSPAPASPIFGTGAGQISSLILTQTPEPSTIALGGLGIAALLAFRRRK